MSDSMTLRASVFCGLEVLGKDMFQSPTRFVGTVADEMDADSVELNVLYRHCDEQFMQAFRPAVESLRTDEISRAYRRCLSYLTETCLLQEHIALRIAKEITLGIADYADAEGGPCAGEGSGVVAVQETARDSAGVFAGSKAGAVQDTPTEDVWGTRPRTVADTVAQTVAATPAQTPLDNGRRVVAEPHSPNVVDVTPRSAGDATPSVSQGVGSGPDGQGDAVAPFAVGSTDLHRDLGNARVRQVRGGSTPAPHVVRNAVLSILAVVGMLAVVAVLVLGRDEGTTSAQVGQVTQDSQQAPTDDEAGTLLQETEGQDAASADSEAADTAEGHGSAKDTEDGAGATLLFDGNGADSGSIEAVWGDGDAVTLPGAEPLRREGYAFLGWLPEGSDELPLSPGEEVAALSEETYLAQWGRLSDADLRVSNAYQHPTEEGGLFIALEVCNDSDVTVDTVASFSFSGREVGPLETLSDTAWSVGPHETVLLTQRSDDPDVVGCSYDVRACEPTYGDASLASGVTMRTVSRDEKGIVVEITNSSEDSAYVQWCTAFGKTASLDFVCERVELPEGERVMEGGQTRTLSFEDARWETVDEHLYAGGYML